MLATKSIVYLSRNKLEYYDNNLPQVLALPFTADLAKDLEVLNAAAVILQIKSFVENNKINPSQLIIALSPDVYFERDFPLTSEFHPESELSKFIDTIPFEHTSSKVYKIENMSKLIATNAEFYNTVKKAFEEGGSIVEAIIPLSILGKDIIIGEILDVTSAKKILERSEVAKQNSLLIYQDTLDKKQDQKMNLKSKSEDNRSLIFLLPILFMLIIVLIILYLRSATG